MSWEEMMEHGVGGGDPDDGYEYGTCLICGEPIDYCQGHSEDERERLGRCCLCGEDFEADDERGEMAGVPKPLWGTSDVQIASGIVHAQCGREAGWGVA